MGLIHPIDLDAYRRDAARRQSFHHLRRVQHSLRGDPGPPSLWLYRSGDEPDVLLSYDSPALSCRVAVLGVLGHLDSARIAILAPFELDEAAREHVAESRPVQTVTKVNDVDAALPNVRTVLSAGAHGPAGSVGHELMQRRGGRSIVIQHGMLLPHVAPLPRDVVLAAWSGADADFWRSGRDDVSTEVVGSELLRRARDADVGAVPVDATPIYCGALHGTELPRWEIERVAREFCRATGARYRPHPSETDLQSRLTRLVWRRLGISFAPSDRPLLEVDSPVVGMWSTGILEAATAGLPSWVFHPDPPEWLIEVWQRYGLSRWGADPTPVSALAVGEPARRLAELVSAEP